MKINNHRDVELFDDANANPICADESAIESLSQAKQTKCSVMSIIAFIASFIVILFVAFITVEFFKTEDLGIVVVALILFVGGLPSVLVSTTLSIISMCIVVKRKCRGKGFAITGLVLNSVCVCAIIVMLLFMSIVK